MRPGNFPTIRLAQLAMLVHESAHLFSKIKEAGSVKEVKKWFDLRLMITGIIIIVLMKHLLIKRKNLVIAMIDNIIINTVVPVLFAYGNYHDEKKYKEKALQWLEEMLPKKIPLQKDFIKLAIENKNAYDSQALIELKNEYCNKKRCLDCGVGNAILKN